VNGDGMAVGCQGEGWNTLACGLTGEVVRKFGTVRLRVMGTSMVPCVHPGDLITVQRASLNEISPGEVVLFTREVGLAAHRVVAKTNALRESCLITRGDRLRDNDPPVSSSALLGRVQFIERSGRRFQPAGRLSIWERMIAPLLRSSDGATYLYLRLAGVCGKVFPGDQSAQE
jgi:signal peptidase I